MNESKSVLVSELSDVIPRLKSHINGIPTLRKFYDENKGVNPQKELQCLAELKRAVDSLTKDFAVLVRLIAEIDEVDLYEKAVKLFRIVKGYNYLDMDCERLCLALSEFMKLLPNTETDIDLSKLGRLANRVKMGYFPTDMAHMEIIKRCLLFPNRTINVLDPCCGEGLALQTLCENQATVTYGIELDRARAEQAETRLNRVGYGSFYFSKISINAFHMIFLNPPYMSVKWNGAAFREEKGFLVEAMHKLMKGGIMIYIIPFYRMTEDICGYLVDNLENITVHRFRESEFKKFKQVVIMGKKKDSKGYVQRGTNADLSKHLQMLSFNSDAIPIIDNMAPQSFVIPDCERSIKTFHGAEFNVNELQNQLEHSSSISFIFDKSKIDTMQRNPILPLKVGQIGLIGGSGLMNGLINCDTPHIIKGRVIKQKSIEMSEDKKLGIKETKETYSNKMVFNVLTADGFKSLT